MELCKGLVKLYGKKEKLMLTQPQALLHTM